MKYRASALARAAHGEAVHAAPPGRFDRVVEVRAGRSLRVRVQEPDGVAATTTVFLAHGAGGRLEQWRLVVPGLLSAGLRVVAWDALGHGRSPAPHRWRDYAGDEFAEDLLALRRSHGTARNLAVGHSYGTRVVLRALTLAAGRPGARPFDAAVLFAPPDPAPAVVRSRLLYLPVWILERLRPRLSAGFRALAWGPETSIAMIDEETAQSDRNSLYVFKAQMRQAIALDTAALRRLDLPVSVIAGEVDRLTPPSGAARLVQSLAVAELHLLPRCGHQIPLERPQEALRSILNVATPSR